MTDINIQLGMPTADIAFDVTGESGVSRLLQEKSVQPLAENQVVLPDSGYYGLSRVNVSSVPSATLVKAGVVTIQYGIATVTGVGFRPDLLVMNFTVQTREGGTIYGSSSAIDFRLEAGMRYGAFKYYGKVGSTYMINILMYNAANTSDGFQISSARYMKTGNNDTTQNVYTGDLDYIAYKF